MGQSFRVSGVRGSAYRVQSLGFRVSGFRVLGLGFSATLRAKALSPKPTKANDIAGALNKNMLGAQPSGDGTALSSMKTYEPQP